MAVDRLEKSTYRKLLMLLILLFYAFPTFLYYDIIGDKGKGLCLLLLLFIISIPILKIADGLTYFLCSILSKTKMKSKVILLINKKDCLIGLFGL